MAGNPAQRAVAGGLAALRLGLGATAALPRTGLIAPVRPDRLVRMAAAPLRLGTGLATLSAIAAARHPDRPAIIDERGALTYAELDRRAAAIAAGLRRDYGAAPGRAVAVMCRNHRGFVESVLAVSRCGADLLSVNTELPAPRLRELLERERPVAVVHDEEFAAKFEDAGLTDKRVLAWHRAPQEQPTLDDLAAVRARPPRERRQGRLILLTSGTTGTPKSAARRPSGHAVAGPAMTFLVRLPFRAREPVLIAPPLFHGFGFSFLAVALFFGSAVVLRRRFEAEEALAAIERHRITALVAVPVMLQRIMELPDEVRGRYDTGSLRTVVSAAAPLSPDLAGAFMDAFGDVLYDVYGTTEAGLGALATPADLRAAPGTVGRPLYGTALRIVDDAHADVVTPHKTGHVFVGSGFAFEGYSDGREKETVDGLINTGDLGHLDAQGRLFIDGREDDMIVSGGENVFPQEVEDVLRNHPAVADAAVLGVADAQFGQRLSAFVVRRPGAAASEDDLKGHVRANLERFKVPREVAFVDDLPRNQVGKVVRKRLTAERVALRGR